MILHNIFIAMKYISVKYICAAHFPVDAITNNYFYKHKVDIVS